MNNDFINNLMALFGITQVEKPSHEKSQSQQKQESIAAQSGDNIHFVDNPQISDRYGDILSDAVKFYQREFNITPHATISNHPEDLPRESILGATSILSDKTGQHSINLIHLNKDDESISNRLAVEGARIGWHPKNSDIAQTPTHEFGHALFGTLFPREDTSSARQGEYFESKFYPVVEDDIYYDALKDLGVEDTDDKGVMDKTLEISKYATSSPAEAVAESLVDYYYNRDDAADLSKAIVKRLKSAGRTYGMKQAGSVDLNSSADNFVKNLRRYRVIQ